MEITVFQAKHRSGAAASQGDLDLKSFVGVSTYLSSAAGIDHLLNSAPNEELRKLVTRLNLSAKLDT